MPMTAIIGPIRLCFIGCGFFTDKLMTVEPMTAIIGRIRFSSLALDSHY